MKVLITEGTFVPHDSEPELGPVHLPQYAVHTCDKDTARRLVDAGRALYTDKGDDPYRGAKTAPDGLLDIAARALKEAEAAQKAAKKANEKSAENALA